MTDNRPVLSLSQEFLCSLDRGETAGALSQWYTVTSGLRLRGNLDVGALSAALDDVVAAVLPDLWWLHDVAVTAKASIPSMAAIRVNFMVISPVVPR